MNPKVALALQLGKIKEQEITTSVPEVLQEWLVALRPTYLVLLIEGGEKSLNFCPHQMLHLLEGQLCKGV